MNEELFGCPSERRSVASDRITPAGCALHKGDGSPLARGGAGNNANGEKADVIEGLDASDQITIIGVATSDLTFKANASSHGVSGIGIYANGALEALYTGNDLSLAQISAITYGDASSAAMNNQISSYGWTSNPGNAKSKGKG